MRFSLLLVICALPSPILAVPTPGKDKVGGRKPGTNVKEKEAHGLRLAPANPSDIILVQSQHFKGADAGKGSSKRKVHPAIVTEHNPDTHIVHVAPIGHEHPGGVPTMPGKDVGLPETPDKTAKQSLVSLGPPKQIHQKDILPLKPLAEGAARDPMPARLTEEHFTHLGQQIGACSRLICRAAQVTNNDADLHNPPAPAPVDQGKGKKKSVNKRELDLGLEERFLLESMLDDEW